MKKRFLFILLALLCLFLNAKAAETVKFSMKYKGEVRTYWLYVPENANASTALVLVFHGYGGSAEGYCPAMLEVAEREGFAVCYPQGEKDAKGKNCWNVGYDVQQGLKRDDVGFVKALVKHIRKKHGIGKDNVFMSGMSNGGEMTYFMAYKYPELFNAFASIAGLTMEWAYKAWQAKKPVPFMEVHGTADKTSMWEATRRIPAAGAPTCPSRRPWATGSPRPAAPTRRLLNFPSRASIPSSSTAIWAETTASRSVSTRSRAASTAGTSPTWTPAGKCGPFSGNI